MSVLVIIMVLLKMGYWTKIFFLIVLSSEVLIFRFRHLFYYWIDLNFIDVRIVIFLKAFLYCLMIDSLF